jgi:hypothetical protein
MVNMQEVWKDVEGYEGYYQVSNLGRVKSLILFKKILKPYPDKDGYFQVVLYRNKTRRLKRVHRLVAQAFIPNENNLPIINHKDEDKANPRMDNLEWCTVRYNSSYGNRVEKMRFTIATKKNKDKVALWEEN